MMAQDIDPPVEWVHSSKSRVDREVERLFDKAFEKFRIETAKAANKRRRAIAQMLEAPLFPEDWGAPLAKYWIVQTAGGEYYTSPTPILRSWTLTVWRWEDFEATATFDLWKLDEQGNGGWGLSFHTNPPRVGQWEKVGPTDNYSTLWRRPLKREAC